MGEKSPSKRLSAFIGLKIHAFFIHVHVRIVCNFAYQRPCWFMLCKVLDVLPPPIRAATLLGSFQSMGLDDVYSRYLTVGGVYFSISRVSGL